jgi:hypothetical protein
MKNSDRLFLLTLVSVFAYARASAQLPVKIVNGSIFVADQNYGRNAQKYAALTDSLDHNLLTHADDTTSLFYRAVLYLDLNDIIAKPYQLAPGALEGLVKGKELAEKAIQLKMQDFRLKVLRAQLYAQLAYRYTGDESWKFNTQQAAARRAQYNQYKTAANTAYDELALLDKRNAYDYQKLKVKGDYPIK